MLFNSLVFLLFFPIFAAAYFGTRGDVRHWVSLIGSYVFYGWWDWRFCFLLFGLTAVNFWIGARLAAARDDRGRRRWLTASVVVSLGVLGFFKYLNFFATSVAAGLASLGLPPQPHLVNVILPVGISFYTFQTMSYTIDLYRRHIEPEPSLLRFSVFVAFFPQLVAGPILRASEFLPQLRTDHVPTLTNAVGGLCLVLWGFVLKSVMADSLAPVVDGRFANPEAHNALSLAIGLVFYGWQIYGDFAGYSLIAIGIARMLGFTFPKNFDRPYFAASFSEFWTRWHISLSTWLRDYLYIPLGGNRRGRLRTYANLMTTMLLGGLWHGAAWTFVFWGLLHGAYLCLQRLVVAQTASIGLAGRMLGVPLVFAAVMVAWTFFRAADFAAATAYLDGIVRGGDWSFAAVEQKFSVVKGIAIVALVAALELVSFRIDVWKLAERQPWLYGGFCLACLWLISIAGTFGNDAFIYFQF